MHLLVLVAMAAAVATFLMAPQAAAQKKAQPPKSLRLYVFDLGSLTMNNPATFGFTKEELGTDTMKFAVVGYLIVHPKGTLMWDVGVIPDSQIESGTAKQGFSTVTRTLKSQMAEIGYAPSDITYLALSHLHSDHTANANAFAGSTWLVHQTERDAMFAPPPPPQEKGKAKGGPSQPSHYNLLKDAKTKILTDKDYDVFGDGKVVIIYTPGHTPGHQVVLLRLPKTGPVLLAGDLYHLPQERAMHRFPTFEFNKDQSAASREKIEAVLAKTKAQLWIEHDWATFEKIKHSPDFIE
jgi:glyoxylase-like metal-dependent hydrolase (beta-lactamase superfamily II)